MIDRSLLRVGDRALVLHPSRGEISVRVVRDGMRPAGMVLDGSGAVDLEGCEVLEIGRMDEGVKKGDVVG